jgi:hypothetical protein
MMESDIHASNWANPQSSAISNMCFKWEGAFTRLGIRIRERAYAENGTTYLLKCKSLEHCKR